MTCRRPYRTRPLRPSLAERRSSSEGRRSCTGRRPSSSPFQFGRSSSRKSVPRVSGRRGSRPSRVRRYMSVWSATLDQLPSARTDTRMANQFGSNCLLVITRTCQMAEKVGSEVGRKPVDLGHELRGPPPNRPLVCGRPQDFPQAPPHLPEGGPVEVKPESRSDDRLRLPHPRELAVVKELVSALLAAIELLPLSLAIFITLRDPHHLHAPLRAIASSASFRLGTDWVEQSGPMASPSTCLGRPCYQHDRLHPLLGAEMHSPIR